MKETPLFLTAEMGCTSSSDSSVTCSTWKLTGMILVVLAAHIYSMDFKLLFLDLDMMLCIVLY